MTDAQVASEQECLRQALTDLFQPFASVTQDERGEWVVSYHDERGEEPHIFTISRGDLVDMHAAAHRALDAYDVLSNHYGRLRRAAREDGGGAA